MAVAGLMGDGQQGLKRRHGKCLPVFPSKTRCKPISAEAATPPLSESGSEVGDCAQGGLGQRWAASMGAASKRVWVLLCQGRWLQGRWWPLYGQRGSQLGSLK